MSMNFKIEFFSNVISIVHQFNFHLEIEEVALSIISDKRFRDNISYIPTAGSRWAKEVSKDSFIKKVSFPMVLNRFCSGNII